MLWALKPIESRMVTEHQARLVLTINGSGLVGEEIRARLRAGGIEIATVNLVVGQDSREYAFRVRELGRSSRDAVPPVIEELANRPGISVLHWSRLE